MPEIVLDEATHTYRVGGIVYPSVTQIIDPAHFGDEWYATRGTYIHQMIEMHVKGTLDEENLDPQLRPYLDAFKKFQVEAPHVKGIGDIKSGAKMLWHLLQIAAYKELWLNGIDPEGKPLKETLQGQEVMGYHPLYQYCGKIDILNVPEEGYPETFDLYLQDTGKYRLERIPQVRMWTHVRNFLMLAKGWHVRKEYKL